MWWAAVYHCVAVMSQMSAALTKEEEIEGKVMNKEEEDGGLLEI